MVATPMIPLQLESFPLDQVSLVEASAGTGKTYALANLYLRYVLEKQFTVDQILVVTFTEAATQELRDRVRSRIHELLRVFEGNASQDSLLTNLAERSMDADADRLRLRLAERQMDQAEIHTIHGFCQRVLAEYVVETGAPIDAALSEDTTDIRRQVIQDFWRHHVLALPKAAIALISSQWPDPDALLLALQPMLNREPEQVLPPPLGEGLPEWQAKFAAYQTWLHTLKTRTLEAYSEVLACLTAAPVKRVNDKLKWLERLREWSESERSDLPIPSTKRWPNLFEAFTPEALQQEMKAGKGDQLPSHVYFEFLSGHLPLQPESLLQQFLVESYLLVRESMVQAKFEQGVLDFDDLIGLVAQALGHDGSNKPAGSVETLIAMIRSRYQVALIDEFQDTDKKQYTIFQKLFGLDCQSASKRLVLIGDPKQAIYGFRGGDIATYLEAKRALGQSPDASIFTMDTNWRSTPEMVAAVNAVFGRRDNAFMAEDIPFVPVAAARDSLPGLNDCALVLHQYLTEDENKEELQSRLAWMSSLKIFDLLEGRASDSPPVESADVAVLVRTASEAELMKLCLAELGIRASFELRARIYDSEEAVGILYLLRALLNPQDSAAIKRCLIEPMFAFDEELLRRFGQDSTYWQVVHHAFLEIGEVWQHHGVLAALRAALGKLDILAGWRQHPNFCQESQWERALSNYNQLSELLQLKSRQLSGRNALVRWLHAQIVDDTAASDENRVRLESDERLVKIITIHKSKGLEYPYVFIPFLFSARDSDLAWFYDNNGRLTLDLNSSESNAESANRERLAEDMRLLYVALTRARYQCFIGTTAYQGRSRGSLGFGATAWSRLVFADPQGADMISTDLDNELLADALRSLAEYSKGMIRHQRYDSEAIDLWYSKSLQYKEKTDLPNVTNPQSLKTRSEPGFEDCLKVRCLDRRLDQRWRVQSFTGLLNESHRLVREPAGALSVLMSQPLATEVRREKQRSCSILSFPRGSQAGTFLHLLFESVEFSSAQLHPSLRARYRDLAALIETGLERSQLVPAETIEGWTGFLTKWLKEVLDAKLFHDFRLSSLANEDYVAEMRFHFSVSQVSPRAFNHLISRFDADAEWLDFVDFSGFLQGAIDLVYRAQGRYFVLDYKSNYLGDGSEDYASTALHEAMKAHRYDLQYLFYVVAVHRLLKQRLGKHYSYEEHFGGVVYLFFRGLEFQEQAEDSSLPGVYFIKPPASLIEGLDKLFTGGAGS